MIYDEDDVISPGTDTGMGTGTGAELDFIMGTGTDMELGTGAELKTGAEPVKRGRGRPKGSKNKPKNTKCTGAKKGARKKRGTGVRHRTGAGKKTGTGTDLITGTGADSGTDERSGTGTGERKKRKYTVSDKALAQRQNNLGMHHPKTPEEFEYNSRLIEHIVHIQEIASQADIRDPVSLKSAFMSYLQLCQRDGFSISNMSAYAAMGVNHSTITKWIREKRPEYSDLALMVRTVCSLSREQQIGDGKINPVIGIFWQRNFDGLRNDTEQTQSVDDVKTDDDKTPSEYVEKYGKLLDE